MRRILFVAGIVLAASFFSPSMLGADDVSCLADFDSDGDVDGKNFSAFAADYGRSNCEPPYPRCHGDFDELGTVSQIDLAVIASQFGKDTCAVGETHPPVVSNLRLSPALLPLPGPGEQYVVSVTFDYADPDGDIGRLTTVYPNADGTSRTRTDSFLPHTDTGSMTEDVIIDAVFGEGTYSFQVKLHDEAGNESSLQSVLLSVETTEPKPLEITDVSPDSGKAGDPVIISGTGFVPDDVSENAVYFQGGKADLLSVTENEMVVVVPPSARSGPVVVEVGSFRTQSADPFTVDTIITIAPAISQIVAGQSVVFTYTVSGGMPETGLLWQVVSQETCYGTECGTITVSDTDCTYTAPDAVPPGNPVTVRCVSGDDIAVFDEVEMEVVLPLPAPGDPVTLGQEGGEVATPDNEVSVIIPADAMEGETEVNIEQLDPNRFPVSSEDLVNTAAVRLSPHGLAFNNPVTVSFSLAAWEEPGTVLTVHSYDEDTMTLTATGRTAVVDETGMTAVAEVGHFSTYVLRKEMPVSRSHLADHFSQPEVVSVFEQFVVSTLPDMPLVEGLTVPFLVKRIGFQGTTVGPFYQGLSVKAVLDDGTELKVLRNPASADGWQLGVEMEIPTLPDCHGATDTAPAETMGGILQISYDDSTTLEVPFEVECLCELDFSGDTPPDPVPAGVSLPRPGTVYLELEETYRFSEINVGPGGRLTLHYDQNMPPVTEPIVLEVTNDVTIEGAFYVHGINGKNGQDGQGNDDGGQGGERGLPHAGQGGIGGPIFSPYDNGHYAIFGGEGGKGGKKWEKPSELSFLVGALLFVVDIGTGNWVGAVQEAYGLASEAVRVYENDENQVASAGRGGWSAPFYQTQDAEIAYFLPPQSGGGGGGSGKCYRSLAKDKAGGGGGGGGGGASGLMMVVDGSLLVKRGGLIDGSGGPGGRGGDGADQIAAPGGGGGGGNGAQIVIIADEVRNNGTIKAPGGPGGISGALEEGGKLVLFETGFGQNADGGLLRVNGKYSGSDPEGFVCFYDGPRIDRRHITHVYTGSEGWFSKDLFPGDYKPDYAMDWLIIKYTDRNIGHYYLKPTVNGTEQGTNVYVKPLDEAPWTSVTWDLTEGLNACSVKVNRESDAIPDSGPSAFISMHPWEQQYVFYFPGSKDTDGDGLRDAMEVEYGTDVNYWDTDDDGYSDSEEVFELKTDPTVPDRYRLTVQETVGGMVHPTPDLQYFDPDTVVTLNAVADMGQKFANWVLGPTGANNPETIVMDGNKTVAAEFTMAANPVEGGVWFEPISLSGMIVTELGLPDVGMAPNGNTIVAWGQPGGVWANRFLSDSGWQGCEEVVSYVDYDFLGPAYVDIADTGHAVVASAWNSASSADWHTIHYIFEPQSGWTNFAVGGQYYPAYENQQYDVDMDMNGNACLAAQGNGSGVWASWVNASDGLRHGESWTPGAFPRVALHSPYKTVAVWVDAHGSPTPRDYIRTATYWTSAGTWSSGTYLSGGAENVDDPGVAIDSQYAIAVWESNGNILASRYQYYTGLIVAPDSVFLEESANAAAHPRIVMDANGNALVVWEQDGSIWFNRYTNIAGVEWGSADLVETNPGTASDPQIAMNSDGNAICVWRESGGTRDALVANVYIAALGWDLPRTVRVAPDGTTLLEKPRIAMDDDGNAVVVWSEKDTGGGQIAMARFSVDTNDTDADGLTDDYERFVIGSEPGETDSDDDGLTDLDEVQIYGTNPTEDDTDNDGLLDGDEINVYDTDPLLMDPDGDGLTDGEEILTYNTDPFHSDSDSDDLTDSEEIFVHGTNPLSQDSDDDWLTDAYETMFSCADPLRQDTDSDGFIDGEEVFIFGTDPCSWDSDGDGLADMDEIFTHGTDPIAKDTDGDGYTDRAEIADGTDPFDSDAYPSYSYSDGVTVIDLPDAEAGGRFGFALEFLSDVDGDGEDDLLIGAPFKDMNGYTDAGRVYLFSNNGSLIRTFDNPDPQDNAHFGHAISRIGSDNYAIAIGAPDQTVDTEGGYVAGGEVFLFSIEGNLIQSMKSDDPQDGAQFGYAIDAAKAWPAEDYHQYFGLTGILIGEPFTESLYSGGRAYLFDVGTGNLRRIMANPTASVGASFGKAVDIQYNLYPDEDLCRLHIGAPAADMNGYPGQGGVFTYAAESYLRSGGDGCDFTLSTPFDLWPSPGYLSIPQSDAAFGASLSSLDMTAHFGDYAPYLAIGAAGYDDPYSDQGVVIQQTLANASGGYWRFGPAPEPGAAFGSSVSNVGNYGIIVTGAPGHTSDEGKAFILDGEDRWGRSHICRDILTSLEPEKGARFGTTLSGSSEGIFAGFVAVGAPDEAVDGRSAQGRVYLFSLQERDQDGDGLLVGMEIHLGTDPNRFDTDGDGWSDGEEIGWSNGPTNPLDPNEFPEELG